MGEQGAVEVRLETTSFVGLGEEPADEGIVHERLDQDVQHRLPVCVVRPPHGCVRCINCHAYIVLILQVKIGVFPVLAR